MSFYKFPHTHNFDQEIGYIIRWFKEHYMDMQTWHSDIDGWHSDVDTWHAETKTFKEQASAYYSYVQARADLIAQIKTELDSLIQGSPVTDAEVRGIRAGADGVTYPTAGESVRTQIDGIYLFDGGHTVNEWVYDKAFYMSTTPPTSLDSPITLVGYRYAKIEVTPGQVFYYSGNNTITTTTGTTYSACRPWGFYDANKNHMSHAPSGSYVDKKVVVPYGAKWLVVQQSSYDNGYRPCYVDGLPNTDKEVKALSPINRALELARGIFSDTSLEYHNDTDVFNYLWKHGDDPLKKKGMTCSSWAMAALFGINSYTQWDGHPTRPGDGYDKYIDLFRWVDTSSTAYEDRAIDAHYGMISQSIAKYIDDKGYSFVPASDFKNVEVGDLIFQSRHDHTGDTMLYSPTNEVLPWYKSIDHVGVVVAKVSKEEAIYLEITNQGYVKVSRLRNNAYSLPTAIRPYTTAIYKNDILYKHVERHPTRTNELLFDVTLPANGIYVMRYTCARGTGSAIRFDVLYEGDTSFTTLLNENHYITNGNTSNLLDDTTFCFKPTKKVLQIKATSIGVESGAERGIYLHDLTIGKGY